MNEKLELWLPYSRDLLTQGFSQNDNDLYKKQRLTGHTAIDWGVVWGTPIPFCADDSYVYSVLNREHPDPTKYRAVYTLVETQSGIYEVSYGHCSAIYAEIGRTYRAGEVLGNIGNTGAVYTGGKAVSKEARLKGSKAGAHLHGPQVRPVTKVLKKTGRQLLYDGNGIYRDKQGYCYEVLDYDNGTNGCIDPEPSFLPYLASNADMVKAGLKKQVSLLQSLLTLLGLQNRR